jgi:hypothetical protein
VVVRALGDDTTIVEAVDPDVMMSMTDGGALDEVAADAKKRLVAALDSLSG